MRTGLESNQSLVLEPVCLFHRHYQYAMVLLVPYVGFSPEVTHFFLAAEALSDLYNFFMLTYK